MDRTAEVRARYGPPPATPTGGSSGFSLTPSSRHHHKRDEPLSSKAEYDWTREELKPKPAPPTPTTSRETLQHHCNKLSFVVNTTPGVVRKVASVSDVFTHEATEAAAIFSSQIVNTKTDKDLRVEQHRRLIDDRIDEAQVKLRSECTRTTRNISPVSSMMFSTGTPRQLMVPNKVAAGGSASVPRQPRSPLQSHPKVPSVAQPLSINNRRAKRPLVDQFLALGDEVKPSPAMYDVIMWERLRHLQDATKSDVNDGSLSLLELIISGFEDLIQYGLSSSSSSSPHTASTSGEGVATLLAEKLLLSVKGGLFYDEGLADAENVQFATHTVVENDMSATDKPTAYANIRGKDLCRQNPTLISYKRALLLQRKENSALRQRMMTLEARSSALESVVAKYQRAYAAVTNGGQLPAEESLSSGCISPTLREGQISPSGSGRGFRPPPAMSVLPMDRRITVAPVTSNHSSRETSPYQDCIITTSAATTPPLSKQVSMQVPPGAASVGQNTGELKPIVQGAQERVLDDLLEQNKALLLRVANHASTLETYKAHLTYLEGRVAEYQAVFTSLVNSNFELSHRYKDAVNSQGLYSPMLFDGRSAEMIALQSNVEIGRLLGTAFDPPVVPPVGQTLTADRAESLGGASSSAAQLQLGRKTSGGANFGVSPRKRSVMMPSGLNNDDNEQ